MNISSKIPALAGLSATLLLSACSSMMQPKPVVVEPANCECPDFTAPLSDTLITVSEARPCPVVAPVIVEKPVVVPAPRKIAPPTDMMVVGQVENVRVEDLKLRFKAKIDSGALFTSINALDMKKFERDGKKWARFAVLHPETGEKTFFELPVIRYKVIKQLSGKYQERPVVLMTLKLGSIKEPVEVTLSDRTGYLYQLLIGRNYMENRMLIDPGKSFLIR